MVSNRNRRAVLCVGLTLAFAATVPAAFAAALDYRIELVGVQPAGPGLTDVTVRLISVRDGKPVADAVIFQTRVDMGPDGMPTMAGKVTPATSDQPGQYRFRAETAMAGGWALTLSAKVQGEQETVRGVVTFKATK